MGSLFSTVYSSYGEKMLLRCYSREAGIQKGTISLKRRGKI